MTLAIRMTMLLGLVLVLPAFGETAREMLDHAREVNDAREPDDVTQKVTMTLVDSRGGKRVRDLAIYGKSYQNEESKGLTFFLSPPEVKGVGFLSWSYPERDDDQWLYLPELKRVRQITSRARRQSFQGSDFTYEDLELFDELRDWTEEDATTKLLREGEEMDGVPCAVIEIVPEGKDLQYGRFVVWLDRETSTFRKIEFYDEKDGEHAKTLLLSDFRDVDGVPTPFRLEMSNLEKGSKTLMEFSEIRHDQGLDDDVFTQRYLERGRVP